MIRARCAAAAAACLLVSVPGARAAFIPAATVDGPSADVLAAGDVELARDGGGALTWVRRDGGTAHVFVSTLTQGSPGPPQRIDPGQALDSSQPRVAVANGGRVLVAWVNDGKLYASLRPDAASAFSAPALAYTPPSGSVRDPSLSMTINGKAYAGVVTSGGDARAAYMAVDGSWSAPDPPLDVDPARTAAGPVVAASGDGSALFAWTETGGDGVGHVFARRAVGTRLSIVAPEASVASLEGRGGGNADSPSVGIELDSARAWVAFRQEFSDGATTTSRALVRPLLASSFDDPPVPIDGLSFPSGAGADHPRLAFTGRGRGTLAASLRAPAGIAGTLLKNDVLGPSRRLDTAAGAAAASYPAPTAADDSTGTVSWQRDPGPGGAPAIVGSHLSAAVIEPEAMLSVPEFGAVDAAGGLYASGDLTGDAAITFAQGDVASRRVVVALYDAPPRSPHAHDERSWRRDPRPKFHWSVVADGWSTSVRYGLEIDHVRVATLAGENTTYFPTRPIPDGDHRWRIVTVDGRGQQTVGRERFLRIDTHRPTVSVRAARGAGRAAVFTIRVSDGTAGSGVPLVTLDFGDGTKGSVPVAGGALARVTHRYRTAGRYTVRATAADRARNKATATAKVSAK